MVRGLGDDGVEDRRGSQQEEQQEGLRLHRPPRHRGRLRRRDCNR